MATVELSMSEVMRRVTLDVKVTGQAVARVRLWLGIRLMTLAAWIIGCCIDVTEAWDEDRAPTSPPPRLSIADPGYDVALGSLLLVTLDGQEQHGVIAYDVEAGTVTRYRMEPGTRRLVVMNERIEQAIEKQLLLPQDQGRYYVQHNVESLLRADSAARAQLYSSLGQNGVMTRNEMRAKENLTPDPSPNADQLTVQSNMTLLDQLGEQPAAAAPAATQADIEALKTAVTARGGGSQPESGQGANLGSASRSKRSTRPVTSRASPPASATSTMVAT